MTRDEKIKLVCEVFLSPMYYTEDQKTEARKTARELLAGMEEKAKPTITSCKLNYKRHSRRC